MPSRPQASFKTDAVGGGLENSKFRLFDDYKYGPDVLSAAKVCSTKGEFSAQKHQKFVSQYLRHKGSLLVYHGLGSGKTCTAILGAEMFKPTYKGKGNKIFKVAGAQKVMIVCPANLVKQTKLEVYGACSSTVHYDGVPQTYNDKSQSQPYDAEIEQIQIELAAARKRKDQIQIDFEKERLVAAKDAKNTFMENAFNDNYEFYSYEKFTRGLFKDSDIAKGKGSLLKNDNAITKGGLLIIDEVQNVVSEGGTWYGLIQHALKHYADKDLRIALLSATPIMNQPGDLGLTLNLLNPKQPFPTTLRGFKDCFVQETTVNDMVVAQGVKNDKKLRQMCANKVSYIAGGNPHEYPYTINTVVHHEMTTQQMGVYQEKIGEVLEHYYKDVDRILGYRKGDKKERDEVPQLWPGPQMIANVYDDRNLLVAMRRNISVAAKMAVIKVHSPKFHSIIQLMEKTDRPVFVHSNFVTDGGVITLLGCLQGIGWKLYDNSTGGSANGKAVGLFIGQNSEFKETTTEAKARMTKVFNSPENMNGKLIKLIIGTVKEGLSLKNVGQVHMIDPWWNMNKLKQIAARAVRYGSHCGLPESERYVHIFTHLSTLPGNKPHTALKALIRTHVSRVLADRPPVKDDTRNPKNTSLNNMWKASINQVMFKSAQKKYTLSNKFDNILKYCAVDRDLNANANAKAVEEYYYPHPSKLGKFVQLKHDPLTGDYFVRNKTERTTTFGEWVSIDEIVGMKCTDFKRYLNTRTQSSRVVRPQLHKYQVRVSRDDTGEMTLKEPVMPKDYSEDLAVTIKDQFITKENVKLMKFDDKEADEECLRILEAAKARIEGATSTVSQADNSQAKKDGVIKVCLDRLNNAYNPGTTLQPGKSNEQHVLYILKTSSKLKKQVLQAGKLPTKRKALTEFVAEFLTQISRPAALEALVNAA